MTIYKHILNKKDKGEKLFAVLIDPDKQNEKSLMNTIEKANHAKVDLFLIGGSILKKDTLDDCLSLLKEYSKIPTILFPGSTMQINNKADGLLFLSLISGRNPELLIGKQVVSAPIIKKSSLEALSTGYMLIDGGTPTTVSYMSNTTPIPRGNNDIALCTAIAGEMLGLKLIYMDAGSGAEKPITKKMINIVRENIKIPLIIGGGINSVDKALASCKAGADIIVVGNAIEKNHLLITKLANAVHAC